jgi:hypothetical protein
MAMGTFRRRNRKGGGTFVGMSNVLSEEKKQQVIALGRLGWPLRRIEQETGVRHSTSTVSFDFTHVVGTGIAQHLIGEGTNRAYQSYQTITNVSRLKHKRKAAVAGWPGGRM